MRDPLRRLSSSAVLAMGMTLSATIVPAIAAPASAAVRSVVAPGAVLAEPERLAAMEREARAWIAERRADFPDAVASAPDPALREAVWSMWLDELTKKSRLAPEETAALQGVVAVQPVTFVRHHDGPHRPRPAYRVASRARALLERQSIRQLADRMMVDPARAIDALVGDDVDDFRAAIVALGELPRSHRERAVSFLADRVAEDRQASRGLIELVRADPGLDRSLALVVVGADPVLARAALRVAMEKGSKSLPELAAAGLARGGLGGIEVAAWVAAGGDVDTLCWKLLADRDSGLEAARALAKSSARLVTTVRAEFDRVGEIARLRMLLALRLRDSEESIALLAELLEDGRLRANERAAAEAWLQ